MSADAMNEILRNAKTIAVVGLSPKPERDSHMVASYMQGHGYTIIPVRPGGDVILGEQSYASLGDLPSTPDIVDVFRNSDDALGVVQEALALTPKPKAVWLQFGVVNEEAAKLCEAAGVPIFMDHCLKVDHALVAGRS